VTYRIRHAQSGRYWAEDEWLHTGQGWQDQDWTDFHSVLSAIDEISYLSVVVHIPAECLTVEVVA